MRLKGRDEVLRRENSFEQGSLKREGVIKMTRGARILLDNVCYHILNRGNHKQNIFLEESDFGKYLQLLKHYKKKYAFKLFGYCLMPNHIHLILEPRQPDNLAKFMQGLTQAYTAWFNKKYRKAGRLWQGRFKSMVVGKDDYFIECIYYIETNPVRAALALSPADYHWSSYRERTFGSENRLLDLPDST
ncbi:MAG: transposase [Candidatus Omnitrophica bacterium]|nr:transposase [Candidatus Omnitrophota bacterium]